MHTKKKEIMLVGGVAASPILREKFQAMAKKYNAEVGVVPPQYAVDNGVMIAWTGLLAYRSGIVIDPIEAIVRQRWRIDEVDIPWR
jgi:N6-L-threonylcarbamoyladenine synthase